MGEFRIVQGKVEDVLPTLDGPFDAVLCDPPYGFNFMGKAWDHGVPAAPIWAEVLAQLRPGAPLLAFGGPRTFHRLAVAIEDAGFEIRDTLCWLFGQGFPKSMDVSKAIDKAAGEEREIVGPPGKGGLGRGNAYGSVSRPHKTIATTDLAAAFTGYGTALKPAWEPVVLAMKPNAGSYAANAAAHGVAGLNVDGTRIATGPSPSIERRQAMAAPNSQRNRGVDGGLWRPGGDGEASKLPHSGEDLGRFPANVALSHQPGCRQVGSRSVRSGTAVMSGGPKTVGVTSILAGTSERVGEFGYAAAGREEVAAWNCEPGCPVAELDQQSGESTTPTQVVQGRSGTGNAYSIGNGAEVRQVASFGDTGGASRFFHTSQPGEVDDGAWECEDGCPVALLDEQSGETVSTDAVRHNAAWEGVTKGPDNAQTSAGFADVGGASRFFYTGKATATERGIGQVKNQHPTVKPIDLCAWLAKMILPPPRLDGRPRRLLVPFSGSGSEVLAALRAGWDEVVGVEMDPQWVEVSRRRIKGDAPLLTTEATS